MRLIKYLIIILAKVLNLLYRFLTVLFAKPYSIDTALMLISTEHNIAKTIVLSDTFAF